MSFDEPKNIYEQELAENRSHYVAIAHAIVKIKAEAEDVVSEFTEKVVSWRQEPGKAADYIAKGKRGSSARAFLATGITRLALNKRNKINRPGYSAPLRSEDSDDPLNNLADPQSPDETTEQAAEHHRHLISEAEDCLVRIAAAGMKRPIEVLRALAKLAKQNYGDAPAHEALRDYLAVSSPGAKLPSLSTLRVQLMQARRALTECMNSKDLNPQF